MGLLISIVVLSVHRYNIRLDDGDTPQKILQQLKDVTFSEDTHDVVWFQYTVEGHQDISTGIVF